MSDTPDIKDTPTSQPQQEHSVGHSDAMLAIASAQALAMSLQNAVATQQNAQTIQSAIVTSICAKMLASKGHVPIDRLMGGKAADNTEEVRRKAPARKAAPAAPKKAAAKKVAAKKAAAPKKAAIKKAAPKK